jgi:hypothetical protein
MKVGMRSVRACGQFGRLPLWKERLDVTKRGFFLWKSAGGEIW